MSDHRRRFLFENIKSIKIFKVFKRLPSDRQKTMTFHYTIIYTCIGVITAIMLAMLIFTDSFIKGWLESKGYTMR